MNAVTLDHYIMRTVRFVVTVTVWTYWLGFYFGKSIHHLNDYLAGKCKECKTTPQLHQLSIIRDELSSYTVKELTKLGVKRAKTKAQSIDYALILV